MMKIGMRMMELSIMIMGRMRMMMEGGRERRSMKDSNSRKLRIMT